MKLIILILLSFKIYSQQYVLYDRYDVSEFYNSGKFRYEPIKADSNRTIIWEVIFDNTNDVIIFRDSLRKDYLAYTINGAEIHGDHIIYLSIIKTKYESMYIYIDFYINDNINCIDVIGPHARQRYRKRICK